MELTVTQGKITADGKVQDTATYLYSLLTDAATGSITMEKKLLVDERRIAAIRRLQGDDKTRAINTLRRTHTSLIPLMAQQAVVLVEEYKAEVRTELSKMAGVSGLYNALFA